MIILYCPFFIKRFLTKKCEQIVNFTHLTTDFALFHKFSLYFTKVRGLFCHQGLYSIRNDLFSDRSDIFFHARLYII